MTKHLSNGLWKLSRPDSERAIIREPDSERIIVVGSPDHL